MAASYTMIMVPEMSRIAWKSTLPEAGIDISVGPAAALNFDA